MTAVMTRLSPAEKFMMARDVAFRDFMEIIEALVAERILPRNLHRVLYKLQPHQVTADKLRVIADALQQLPSLEERYRFALELRHRREAILPRLVDFRDQAPANLRGNVSYVLKVSPGLGDYRSRLRGYDETLSSLEKWVEAREQQVEHERCVAQTRAMKNQGVPASCRSHGCNPAHASKRAHDMARAQYAPKKGQNGRKR